MNNGWNSPQSGKGERSEPYGKGAAPKGTPGGASGSTAPGQNPGAWTMEIEKANLMQRLSITVLKHPNAKSKWWSWCKVLGHNGCFDAKDYDPAFIQTFFEAFEKDDIPDEPDCPFLKPEQPAQAQGGKDGGKGKQGDAWGQQGGGWGQQGGQQQAQGSWGPPAAKGGWGESQQAQGGGWQGGGQAQASGSVEGAKIFVGGVPRAATEEAVKQHFSWYGNVKQIQMKYDQTTGDFRGFLFVEFDSAEVAAKVCADKTGNQFMGKALDCKPADASKGKGGGKGKQGKGDEQKGGGGGCWGNQGGAQGGDGGKGGWGGQPW